MLAKMDNCFRNVGSSCPFWLVSTNVSIITDYCMMQNVHDQSCSQILASPISWNGTNAHT